ncbi:unnamed protein product [Nezara viridula]|uniref:Neuropeptide n=1 Tax=Nezara viridula TaxID=85310 RepID=A0A9P0H2C1_NEZVI|nr:unnamed protein product [Nezara viridula]
MSSLNSNNTMGLMRASLVSILSFGFMLSLFCEEVLGEEDYENDDDDEQEKPELFARVGMPIKQYMDGLIRNNIMRNIEVLK